MVPNKKLPELVIDYRLACFPGTMCWYMAILSFAVAKYCLDSASGLSLLTLTNLSTALVISCVCFFVFAILILISSLGANINTSPFFLVPFIDKNMWIKQPPKDPQVKK